MRLSARVMLVLAVGLLAAAACSSGSPQEAASGSYGSRSTDGIRPESSTTTTTTATSTTTPGSPASPLSPEEAALAGLLLDEPPLPGFHRTGEGSGPLDLESASKAEADVPAERALLETRHFVRGFSRRWIDDAGDVVYLAVYTFAAANDADLYLRDGIQTLVARGATIFDGPETLGGLGFTDATEGAGGSFTTHAVAFTSGEHWVLAIVGSRGSGRTPDDARALAVAQAAHLATPSG